MGASHLVTGQSRRQPREPVSTHGPREAVGAFGRCRTADGPLLCQAAAYRLFLDQFCRSAGSCGRRLSGWRRQRRIVGGAAVLGCGGVLAAFGLLVEAQFMVRLPPRLRRTLPAAAPDQTGTGAMPVKRAKASLWGNR